MSYTAMECADVLDRGIAACAEFPNDNPALHEGSLWYCAGLTSPVTPELRAVPDVVAAPEVVVEPATEPTPPVMLECDDAEDGDDIEIVDELPLEDALDEFEGTKSPNNGAGRHLMRARSESAPPPEAMPPAAEDPYASLMRVLEQVARDAGAPDAAIATLQTVLGQLRIDAGAPSDHHRMRAEALAWRGILRGESEDFAACGVSMLDEWSALLVATVLGAPGKADTLKRDLRRQGVAAFGLVDQAA